MNKRDDFLIYGRLVFVFYIVAMMLIVILNFSGIIELSWLWAFSPIWMLIILAIIGFVIHKLIRKWRNE